MSNLEAQPEETVCAAGPGTAGAVEVLEPREVPLGGLRGMPVRRTLPQRGRSLIGAWCFLDHYGPDDVAESGGMQVRAHPHTGLQTASWLFSGTIEHRDSAGNHAMVRPGELNLMTAGSGISHSERSTPDTTLLHGAQLWIALPAHARGIAKRFDHYVPPLLTGDGYSAQVFLGSLLGQHSPVETHTPLVGAELTLEAGTSLTLGVEPTHEHGLLVDTGSATLSPDKAGGTSLRANDLGFAAAGCAELTITAGADGAHLLLIGGAPFEDELVMWWNFIGGSHEEVAAARDAWQATISTRKPDAADRFGLPDDEPEPPLPAPELPTARLLPRSKLGPLPPATGTLATAGRDASTSHSSSKEAPMSDTAEHIRVAHEPDSSRYAIYVERALAGFTEYRVPARGNARAFVHTEVSPEFGGRGLAGTLVTEAMADTRAAGMRIVPYCPYVSAWLKKHPEYEEIVDWPNT